ncbi:hypothetical protein LCGC14_1796760 [marine sediment metagenome]|uniref:Uncharacterized protein n=1 Tax=marine sediment metagenome TaxID=412755 RepID=A0A0F9J5M8_9ZZZZ
MKAKNKKKLAAGLRTTVKKVLGKPKTGNFKNLGF